MRRLIFVKGRQILNFVFTANKVMMRNDAQEKDPFYLF